MPVLQAENFVQITWSPNSQYEHPNYKHSAHFYRKVIVGNLILCQGDFVLIRNEESGGIDDDDDDLQCEVAQILHLYENLDPDFNDDPCRAVVQWYSRPDSLRKYSRNHDLDIQNEVVFESRPFDSDISIETVTKLCTVENVEESVIPRSLAQPTKKQRMMPFYVCRYKLIKKSERYVLVPLLGEIRTEYSNRSAKKEALSASKRKIVSPIKITKNGVEKIHRSGSKESVISDIENVSPNKHKRLGEVKESPLLARRNLNDSFGTDNTPDVLNYSIVNRGTPSTNDLNICLRISQRQKYTNPKYEDYESPNRKRTAEQPPTHKTPQKSAKKTTPVEVPTPTTSRILTRRASVAAIAESVQPKTPTTKSITTRRSSVTCTTPSTTLIHPRRSILKTPSKGGSIDSPKKRLTLSHIVEEVNQDGRVTKTPSRSCKSNKTGGYYFDDIPVTPPSGEKRPVGRPPKKTATTPSSKLKQIRSGEITPSIHARSQPVNKRRSQLEVARENLHVSAILKSLPCRETEFENVYRFVEGKLLDKCGGCMYISGVPGTGKTATVTQAIKALKKSADEDDLPEFEFIEINGMRLTEPRQAYVQIYKQLTGKTLAWEQAHNLLEKRFLTPAPRRLTTVLLVDELDILCNRRQDVVYNLLDWPSKSSAQLVVITIANTMDLPERLLMGKVASRLGLTRLTFQPYTHKQLQEIVTTRLAGTKAFESDAIQLVARKVASVSGDARRALDICRRATEVAELDSNVSGKNQMVTMLHVQKAVQEMIASVKVLAIKSFSKLEQIFLQAVAAEVTRTGIEETSFLGVYSQFEAIASISGIKVPAPTRTIQLCSKLGASRLLICEHSRMDVYMKILLNVSVDDIHYALQAQI